MPPFKFFLSGLGGKTGKGAVAPAENKQKNNKKPITQHLTPCKAKSPPLPIHLEEIQAAPTRDPCPQGSPCSEARNLPGGAELRMRDL